MAIFSKEFIKYTQNLYSRKKSFCDFDDDPILSLGKICAVGPTLNNPYAHTEDQIKNAEILYSRFGFVGIIKAYFGGPITDNFIDPENERKVYILKTGLKALPATKAEILLKGFNLKDLTLEGVKQVYASYGLGRGDNNLLSELDFLSINHRVKTLSDLLKEPVGSKKLQRIQNRFIALLNYSEANNGVKKPAIIKSMSRTLFYMYHNQVQKYGMIGLFDKSKQVIRVSRIGAKHETNIIMHRIQHPATSKRYYINYLAYNGIQIDRSTISKLLKRWNVSGFQSVYLSNLKRLEESELAGAQTSSALPEETSPIQRHVFDNYLGLLEGLSSSNLFIDAPGLPVIWYYLEKLGIFPILHQMGYARNEEGCKYSWFEYFLYTVARIFYGIPTYGASCLHQEPSLTFFTGLIKAPSLSSLLEKLDSMPETDVFKLQKLLIQKLKTLKLIQGKRIAFDFKQIDLEVQNSRLRNFGKGPSPKKKICYNGFRPHIAWDLDTKNLIIMDFRKASARGTTTIRRFINEFLSNVFKENFEQVYIDSEYTAKDVWNYIMDDNQGMNAEMIGCLKQNKFVKKYRDKFLEQNQTKDNFWLYWDKNHIYSSLIFKLQWEYKNPKNGITKSLTLNCVVKKNINNGSLRCFGCSWLNNATKILEEYGHRWGIEIGIKDLTYSYFLNKIPSCESPNLVNIHFLIVSICHHIYQMITQDTGKELLNNDDSCKTLMTTRELLIRQGAAQISRKNNTLCINFANSFSIERHKFLSGFFEKIKNQYPQGLQIIGGLKVDFILKPPLGKEHKNSNSKSILSNENFL